MSTDFIIKLAWSFGRAFVGGFIIGITGIQAVPDLSTAKALVFAAIVGGITAGIRAIEQTLLGGMAHVKAKKT